MSLSLIFCSMLQFSGGGGVGGGTDKITTDATGAQYIHVRRIGPACLQYRCSLERVASRLTSERELTFEARNR